MTTMSSNMSEDDIKKVLKLIDDATGEFNDFEACRELWKDGGVETEHFKCKECRMEDRPCIRATVADLLKTVIDPEKNEIHFVKPIVACCLTCLRQTFLEDTSDFCNFELDLDFTKSEGRGHNGLLDPYAHGEPIFGYTVQQIQTYVAPLRAKIVQDHEDGIMTSKRHPCDTVSLIKRLAVGAERQDDDLNTARYSLPSGDRYDGIRAQLDQERRLNVQEAIINIAELSSDRAELRARLEKRRKD